MKLLLICIGALVFSPMGALAQADVQRSHIEANVPPAGQADAILQRDLSAYFVKVMGRPVISVQTTALRDGPTQSGASYPKFYFWVQAVADGGVLAEGAVRVAAIDRVRFAVTDFQSKESIRVAPDQVGKVFPQALVSSVLQRAGVKP